MQYQGTQGIGRKLWIGILVYLLAAVVQAEPVAWDAAGSRWMVRDSAHFSLHVRQGQELHAERILNLAEQVHRELVPFFGQAPRQKTILVLVDDFDYSNGWATPLPFAQIRLYLSPPTELSGLYSLDEWMHGLIRHEYVHILHMEMGRGVVQGLRQVFGRNPFLFPHGMTPGLFVEGLAVYLESDEQLGYGRLQSSYYAMQLRMEVASGRFRDLNEVVVANRKWPRGHQYLYGAYFIRYLAETYGEERLQAYLKDYSGNLLPFLLQNPDASRAFGKNFEALWADFRRATEARLLPEIQRLQQQEHSGRVLARYPIQPIYASRGGQLLVRVSNGEDRAAILQPLSADAWVAAPRVAYVDRLESLDVTQSGQPVIAQLNAYRDGRALADLYRLPTDSGNWLRLTDRQRFRALRLLPDDQMAIASRVDQGLSELWRVPVAGQGKAERLWVGAQGEVVGDFALSPDGRWLAASVKRPAQDWNLALLDLVSLEWTLLTGTAHTETAPAFVDDDTLLFSADYDGVFNLYRLNLADRQLVHLTREVGGAFDPVFWPGQGVLYTSYESEGYAVRLLPLSALDGLESLDLADLGGARNYPDPVQQVASQSAFRAYSPWPSIRPRTWWAGMVADGQQTRFDLTLSGADALSRHTYQVTLSQDFKNDLGGFNLNYAYDNRWSLIGNREHDFVRRGGFDDQIRRSENLTLQRNHLLTFLEDKLSLHAGLYWDEARYVDPAGGMGSQAWYEGLAGLALTYQDQLAFLNVPDVGWGHYADLVVETNDLLPSRYEGFKVQGQWQTTYDLPGRTSLSWRLAVGYAEDQARPFEVGGRDLSLESRLFGRTEQAIRGYDSAAQVGQYYLAPRLVMDRWLTRVERNWGLLPIGIGDVSGSLFVDAGSAWQRGADPDWLVGTGVELMVELIVAYGGVIPARLGYARGLDDALGDDHFYLRMGMVW